jgi:alpha-tubulin suppressor-like RCC1 family protein
MSQQKAQIISPIDTFTTSGLNVTGVVTSTSFVGSATGTATGLSGTPDINVGIVTATGFYGDGSGLTGAVPPAFVGQSTTSQSPTTTIDLSAGNVIYFTHDTDTTVAFASTGTVEKVKFIRTKDATSTPRSITWPTSVYWNNGVTPILVTNPRTTSAQTFNLTTRDGGVTWYAYEEVNADPQTFSLFSWGLNSSGQLGQNNETRYSSPVQIPGLTWSSISGGGTHSLATKTDGTLWSWGSNGSGQLGQNNQTVYSSPVQISGTTWSSISTGNFHSLAIKTDGTLWSWGSNAQGQLGQNNTTYRSSPVQIPGTTWNSITSGRRHSLATKTDGTLWSWGYNYFGQLGQNNRGFTNRSSPTQIPGTTWSSISCGDIHSLATKTDGTLWAWGHNTQGALGQNNTTEYSSPVQIPGTTWSSISGGRSGQNSLATKTDGTLWAWGQNQFGQLGQSNRTYYSSPIQIPGTNWSSISLNRHSLATKTDGTLWSWGYNSSGQLGQNNRTYYSSPVQIPGTEWSSITAAGQHSLALQFTS